MVTVATVTGGRSYGTYGHESVERFGHPVAVATVTAGRSYGHLRSPTVTTYGHLRSPPTVTYRRATDAILLPLEAQAIQKQLAKMETAARASEEERRELLEKVLLWDV